jgi:hypothetical protein
MQKASHSLLPSSPEQVQQSLQHTLHHKSGLVKSYGKPFCIQVVQAETFS